MRPIPLSDNLADKSHQGDARTEAAAIHAEIAERMLELRETIGERHAVGFYRKALIVWTLYPPAYWVLMHLMTGDLSEVTNSYTMIGKQDARTKQAVQQEWERILNAIAPHYPELSHAIVQIRNMSAKLADDDASTHSDIKE